MFIYIIFESLKGAGMASIRPDYLLSVQCSQFNGILDILISLFPFKIYGNAIIVSILFFVPGKKYKIK